MFTLHETWPLLWTEGDYLRKHEQSLTHTSVSLFKNIAEQIGGIHPLSITAYILGGVWGGLTKLSLGDGTGTSRTSRQFVTYRQTPTHAHIHTYRQRTVRTSPNVHVFGLWEEAGALDPGTLAPWGNSAKNCTTVPSNNVAPFYLELWPDRPVWTGKVCAQGECHGLLWLPFFCGVFKVACKFPPLCLW